MESDKDYTQPLYLQSTKIKRIYALNDGEDTDDLIVVEEPLEIRLEFGSAEHREQKSLSVTMRTPGHDLELAVGFLFSESIIKRKRDIRTVRHCHSSTLKPEEVGNVVLVSLQPHIVPDLQKLEKFFYTSSSCGVCGKSSLEAVAQTCHILWNQKVEVSPEVLEGLSEKLRYHQAVFKHTGGLHAAGLFDSKGNLQLIREDVGRHNALDKLIGAALMEDRLPLQNHIIFLSSRLSFELVQKSLMAEVPVLCAVSAPSSLAVNLARAHGQTLVGFMRKGKFNVYSDRERVVLAGQ